MRNELPKYQAPTHTDMDIDTWARESLILADERNGVVIIKRNKVIKLTYTHT